MSEFKKVGETSFAQVTTEEKTVTYDVATLEASRANLEKELASVNALLEAAKKLGLSVV